jgi:hypothetical protein
VLIGETMNRFIFRSLIAAFMLVLMFGVPSIASADGITWDLSGVTFDDGGTASGSFFYDAVANKFDPISVKTTSGSVLTGATYTSLSFLGGSSDTGLLLGVSGGDATNTSLLFLLFDATLTNSGGVIKLSIMPPDNNSVEGFCHDPLCSDFTMRSVTGGELVSEAVKTPEPASISLLGMGFIALLISAAIRKLLFD